MRMHVLVNYCTMAVHVLVDQVRGQKQLQIVDNLSGFPVHFDAVVLSYDHRPLADLLYDIQIVSGSDYGLPGLGQLLQKLNQPQLRSGGPGRPWARPGEGYQDC